MSPGLPTRPKSLRQASRLSKMLSAVDSNNPEKAKEVRDESIMSESDDEPTINDSKIEEAMERIHRITISLIGIISKAVILDRFSWPQLADMHIWYSECYDLFRLGLGFEAENLDSVFRRLKVNLDDVTVYLRMLVVADVYNKILITDYPDLPFFSQHWINATFEPIIKKLDAQSRAEVKKIAIRALSRQQAIDEKLNKLPEKLTCELFEALNPLLLCYKSPAVDREASRSRRHKLEQEYGERLAEIYKHAIKLRKALSLKHYNYSFFWIQAGQDFDETTMDMEINSRRDKFYSPAANEQHKVKATMLPGVCRNESQTDIGIIVADPSKEKNIVLRALVSVGEVERGSKRKGVVI